MANFTKGAKKAAAARKGHRNTTKRKSHAGVRKGAWARRAKLRRKK
jgi:hypothetical protein